MRILLQTLDHGLQYKLAQTLLLSLKNPNHEIKIVELKSENKKKSFFGKIKFYYKRQKIKPLIINILSRFFNKKEHKAYSEKSKLIDKLLEKYVVPLDNNLITYVNHVKEVQSLISKWKPDTVLVIGAPFLPKDYFINGTRYINLHIGKIPDYRGLKCIEWALINNDYSSIGYTVHEMTHRLDHGGIYYYESIDYYNKTLSEIYAECYASGIRNSIEIALNKKSPIIYKPKYSGKLFYSIDFNNFVIEKVCKIIDV